MFTKVTTSRQVSTMGLRVWRHLTQIFGIYIYQVLVCVGVLTVNASEALISTLLKISSQNIKSAYFWNTLVFLYFLLNYVRLGEIIECDSTTYHLVFLLISNYPGKWIKVSFVIVLDSTSQFYSQSVDIRNSLAFNRPSFDGQFWSNISNVPTVTAVVCHTSIDD